LKGRGEKLTGGAKSRKGGVKSSRARQNYSLFYCDIKPLQSKPFHSINLLSHFDLLRGIVSTNSAQGGRAGTAAAERLRRAALGRPVGETNRKIGLKN